MCIPGSTGKSSRPDWVQHRVGARRAGHDEGPRVPHEAAEAHRRRVVEARELLPGRARAPLAEGLLDRRLVEPGGLAQPPHLGGRLDLAHGLERPVGVGHLHARRRHGVREAQVVEPDPAAAEPEVAHGPRRGLDEAGGVAVARSPAGRALEQGRGHVALQGRGTPGDVQRRQERGVRTDVGDPAGLEQHVRHVELRDHQDRVCGLGARDHHRGVPVGLGDGGAGRRSEPAQVEHVGAQVGHEPVQTALLEGRDQPVEVAEALGGRIGRGRRGRRGVESCVHRVPPGRRVDAVER